VAHELTLFSFSAELAAKIKVMLPKEYNISRGYGKDKEGNEVELISS